MNTIYKRETVVRVEQVKQSEKEKQLIKKVDDHSESLKDYNKRNKLLPIR